jgi:putative transposase
MPRVPRTSLPDGWFHVVARGVPETPIFLGDADRTQFVQLLGRIESKHAWICHAYCLMATHYHLALETTRSALSRGLGELNGTYARVFNRRHGRFGHLFSDRSSTRVIDSEEYLYDACSYVLLNPVKAGLCDRIEDWPWSYSRIGLGSS